MRKRLLYTASLLTLCLAAIAHAALRAPESRAAQDGAGAADDAEAEALKLLESAFEEQGIQLDVDAQVCGVPANVCIREDLLEYLVVGPVGAAHEALLSTDVTPSLLNTALVALGVRPGVNAQWVEVDPAPTPEEVTAGAPTHEVIPPKGDGLYLYVAWQDGDERYFFRIEDVLRNLDRRASMQRHGWVYLGSRMILHGSRQEERFAAGVDGNLINISFFSSGNTIVTAAMDECVKQTVWLPNPWILPRRDAKVSLVLSRTRLQAMPESVASSLPDLAEQSFMDEDWRR